MSAEELAEETEPWLCFLSNLYVSSYLFLGRAGSMVLFFWVGSSVFFTVYSLHGRYDIAGFLQDDIDFFFIIIF